MDAFMKRNRTRMEPFPGPVISSYISERDMIGRVPFREPKGKEREYSNSEDTSFASTPFPSSVPSNRSSVEGVRGDGSAGNCSVREVTSRQSASYEENPIGEGCSLWFSRESLDLPGNGRHFSKEERRALKSGNRTRYGRLRDISGDLNNDDQASDNEKTPVCDSPGVAFIKGRVRAVAKLAGGLPLLKTPRIVARRYGYQFKRLRDTVKPERYPISS